MLKVLAFMLLMTSYKGALADDILNPDKQVLICMYSATDFERMTGAVKAYNEHYIRMNWSDWDSEKEYVIKHKLYTLSFTAHINFLDPDQKYQVRHEFRHEDVGGEFGGQNLEPDMSRNVDCSEQMLHRIMYIDFSVRDSEIPSICRKNFQHNVTRAFQLKKIKSPDPDTISQKPLSPL